MGLVDDRPVDLGGELLDRPAPVVHPDLDERDALFRQRAHEVATLGRARHAARRRPEGRGPGAGVRRRQPAAGREEPGPAERPGLLLAPDLPPQAARVRAERDDRADAVVGVAAQVVEDVLARVVRGLVAQAALEADVPVEVDERGDDRLPGDVDDGRAGRDVDGAARSGRPDDAAGDDQRRILDRRPTVAGDQPCAGVDDVRRRLCGRRPFRRPRSAGGRVRAADEDGGKQADGCRPAPARTLRCGRRDPGRRFGGHTPLAFHRIVSPRLGCRSLRRQLAACGHIIAVGK